MANIEEIRRRYRPKKINTLFVGESAPASGNFFYLGDTQMARYMSRAFSDPPDFLSWFKDQGYYLDDLVLKPINHWTAAQRRDAHRSSTTSLSQRIRDYSPLAIVTVLIKIDASVREAIRGAQWDGQYFAVPFPGNGQQRRFLNEMASIIPELPSSGTLKPQRGTRSQSVSHTHTKSRAPRNIVSSNEEIDLRQIMSEFGVDPRDIRRIGKAVRRQLRAAFAQHDKWSRWVFVRGSAEYNVVLSIFEQQRRWGGD